MQVRLIILSERGRLVHEETVENTEKYGLRDKNPAVTRSIAWLKSISERLPGHSLKITPNNKV